MRLIISAIFYFILSFSFGQSVSNNSCESASSIAFDDEGAACVYFTSNNVTQSNFNLTTNGACTQNYNGPDLFYQFTAEGSSLVLNLNPLGNDPIEDPIVYLLQGDCETHNLLKCASSDNTNSVTLENTLTPGETYFVIVASKTQEMGGFELCLNNNNDTDDPGDRCDVAGRICDKSTLEYENLVNYQSSGTFPNCFSFQARRDVWLIFTVSKSGTLEFIIDPIGPTEYDWALFDASNGCDFLADNRPAALACNYNYTQDEGAPTGMSSVPTNYPFPGEITAPINVEAGKSYALMIDNFTRSTNGFSLEWGGTFEIITSVFDLDNAFGCDSVEVGFEHTNLPNYVYDWDFGDGTGFIGPNPPNKIYREEGNYTISLQVEDVVTGCNAVSSQIVTVSKPTLSSNYTDTVVCEGSDLYTAAQFSLTETISPVSFTTKQDRTIPDNNLNGVLAPLDVNIPNAGLLQTDDIKRVCISIQHPTVGDLSVELQSPSGSSIMLVNQKGGTESDFLNTCFSNLSTNNISNATGPFTSTFAPDGSFNDLNGQPINGTWNLKVTDKNGLNTGYIDDWSLYLENGNNASFTWSPFHLFEDSSQTTHVLNIPEVNQDSTLNLNVTLVDNLGCTLNKDLSIQINNNADPGVAGDPVDLCNSGTVNLFDYFTSAPDMGGTWAGNNGNAGLNTVSGDLSLDGYAPGTYTFTYTLPEKLPCPPASADITLNVFNQPNPGNDTTVQFCASAGKINLFNELGGNPDNGGVWRDLDNSDSFNAATQELALELLNGSYRFTYVQEGAFNCTADSSLITVQVNQAPEIFLDSLVCTPANDSYQVYAKLSGGDPSSYVVNPSTGNLSGNLFTSDPIPAGSTFNFSAQDANNCPSRAAQANSISGTYDCNCITSAGDFTNKSVQTICFNDSLRLAHNGQGNLDANDARMYVVHSNAGPSLGTVFLEIPFSPVVRIAASDFGGLNLNTTYYFSVVAGDQGGNGVDLSDPSECMQVSPGVPFQLKPKPTVQVTWLGTDPICEGTDANFRVEITAGDAPFDLRINGNLNAGLPQNGTEALTAFSSPTSTFVFDNVEDANGCASDTNFSIGIPVNPKVNHVINAISCDPNNQNYEVEIKISADFTRNIEQRGLNTFNQVNDSIYISEFIPSGTSYSAIFNYDEGNCPDDSIQGIHYCDCGSEAGLVRWSNPQYYFCENSSATVADSSNAFLEPNDLANYILVSDTNDLSSILQQQNQATFDFSSLTPATKYFVARAVGDSLSSGLTNLSDTCLSVSNWLEFRILETPTFTYGLSSDTVCQFSGNQLFIALPFVPQVAIEISGTLFSPFGVASAIDTVIAAGIQSLIFPINNPDSGRYQFELTEAKYRNTPSCVENYTFPGSFYSSAAPLISIDGNLSFCPEDETIFEVEYLQGFGSVDLEFSINGTSHFRDIDKTDSVRFNLPSGNYTIQLISVRDQTSRACLGSGIGTVDVLVFDTPQMALAAVDTPLCEQSTFNAKLLPIGNHQAYDFNYTTSEGNMGNETVIQGDSSTLFNLTMNEQLTLFITDFTSTEGCLGPDTQYTVTAETRPQIIVNNQLEFCEGNPAVLDYVIVGNEPYTITFEETVTGDQQTFTVNSTANSVLNAPRDTSFYRVNEITDHLGCTMLNPGNPDILVIRNQKPVPQISLFNTEGCGFVKFGVLNETQNVNLSQCIWNTSGGTQTTCDTAFTFIDRSKTEQVSLQMFSTKGCRGDTAFQTEISVRPKPAADFIITPNQVTRQNTEVNFINTTPGSGYSFQWDFAGLDSAFTQNATYEFPREDTGTYWVHLIAENEFNCLDTAYGTVKVSDRLTVFIPNSFSPNQDQLNEVFVPVIPWEDVERYQLIIYNRWGQEIFETQTLVHGWDGTYAGEPVPVGVYAFRFVAKARFEEKEHTVTGKVQLVR